MENCVHPEERLVINIGKNVSKQTRSSFTHPFLENFSQTLVIFITIVIILIFHF